MKTVINKRFKSVFVASLASMMISYLLGLTDNIVAGQFINDDAVAAMTLIAPIMVLIFFLSYMIADGLAMMFSYAKGKNDQTKANEIFSMGTICSVVSGVVITTLMIVFQNEILSIWDISPELMTYAIGYYSGLKFVALPCILNIYFYTIYIAEGEEDICVRASAAMFIVNVILDIVLGYYIGVIGIGIATTIGNLVSFLWHIPYLFSSKCQLRFVKYWNSKEFWQGIFYSWYHSMDTLYLTLLPIVFLQFVLYNFGEDYLIVVTVIMNILMLLFSIYTGIVDCLQPMVCQYHAERALHSVQKTMILGRKYTIGVTLAIILFSFVFAEFLPGLFGVNREEMLYSECVHAVRIFMPFTLFLGLTLMLSNYYVYIERLNLGAAMKTLLLMILPSVGMFLGVFGIKLMWVGVGLSFIVSFVINLLWTRRNLLLINWQEYSRQFSFDTESNIEKLKELRLAMEKYLSKNNLPRVILALTEEIFTKYASRSAKCQIEVTVIPAERLILIFRENGEPQEPVLNKPLEKNYMISGDENKFVVLM